MGAPAGKGLLPRVMATQVVALNPSLAKLIMTPLRAIS